MDWRYDLGDERRPFMNQIRTKRLNVLVVDDDANRRSVFADQLPDCDVTFANSATEAMAILRAGSRPWWAKTYLWLLAWPFWRLRTALAPNIVLADIDLDDGSGLDVLEEARRLCSEAGRFAMSANSETIRANAKDDTAHRILRKPSKELGFRLAPRRVISC